MDPDITYWQMFEAMACGDYNTARQHALELRE